MNTETKYLQWTQEKKPTAALSLSSPYSQSGEGNGTPLQYSCLENPWTGEPGRLQSMRSLRVGNDWATSLSLFTSMHWRRKWQPTPVFLPGESRDGEAWWAAISGVAQSRTRLKRLSSSSSNSQSRVYVQKRQLNSKRYVHPNCQSSTIYNSQDKKQPKCQSTDDWVKNMWVKWNIMFVLVAQLCLTLCNPVDCSPPGSPVHGILQGRIPEWVAIPFPRGSSQSRDWTFGFCIVGRFFTIWVTGKAQNGTLFSHKKEWKIATCSNMDGPRDHHTKWNVTEKQILYDITYMWNFKNNTNESIYKAETDLQM